MRFADPQACPDCRGVIAGQSTCPHCGLDLTSREVRQLWQTLLQADDLLAKAVQNRAHAAAPVQPVAKPKNAPSAAKVAAAAAAPTAPYPTHPAQVQQPPQKDRTWNAGTILLALGAFGLIVAGLIFVTRSWEDIGLAGKTLVLLGVTAVIGTLGVWLTKRPLRSSAEAVWTVFLALLTLDFFAARHEGLAGLDGMNIQWAWIVWGVVSLALGVGIAVWARPLVKADLIAPVIAGGLGIKLGWQAPFVSGVVIVTMLVLFNIGPYANAAPRVVVIAVVSAILLGVGITWEDRVRDGRKPVGYVRSMR